MAKPCAIPECVSLRTKDSYLCAVHQADADNKRTFSTPETPAAPKAHKYGAVRTAVDGITFHSKAEASTYADLKLMERGGLIRNLELQPSFPIVIIGLDGSETTVAHYRADFRFFDVPQQRVRVLFTKGVDTRLSDLKRKIVHARYGIDVEIVS